MLIGESKVSSGLDKILSPLGLTSRRVHYASGNLCNSVVLFDSPLHLVDIWLQTLEEKPSL